MTVRYGALAKLLSETRMSVGIALQSELATLVNTTQQSVSRWEAGSSRPREKEIPVLARALCGEGNVATLEARLLEAAGYSSPFSSAVVVLPFPTDALAPDIFEEFVAYVLQQIHPSSKVHRLGKTGHTQQGSDIEAAFADGTSASYQCKRVSQFGPAKIREAVKAYARYSDKIFIVLSRVASPDARDEIAKYPGWGILDRDDLSLMIRQNLSPDQCRRLVDLYFRGQRLALLNESEAGPWQTEAEFFAPFSDHLSSFNHRWSLVGRNAEINTLLGLLEDDQKRAIILTAPGGGGKTRILKEAIAQHAGKAPAVVIRFLSVTQKVTPKSLEDLGDREKLLVVDDAHDRDDLNVLFEFAANPGHRTKLLISLRPYGLDFCRMQAAHFSLLDVRVAELPLAPLSLTTATELAGQVLESAGASKDAAADIARATRDCLLATVIGAQIVAQKNIPLELVKQEIVFRNAIMARYEKIATGNIGNAADEPLIKKLLELVALIQPFHIVDESVLELLEVVQGLQRHDAARLFKLLINAGVIFKRGNAYRISPDLLADFLMERSCIGEGGASTGFAEKVFDAAQGNNIENLLVNLGRLDWRYSDGDASNSPLMDGVWSRLKPTSDYSDAHSKALVSVAYFQPLRTLQLAERLIREGKIPRGLPNAIKGAGYTQKYLERACECLWELGKNDKRELHPHPSHAIRVLNELGEVEPNKPIEFNRIVVEFGLKLIGKPDAWDCAYSPLDLLGAILKTEGHTTTSNARGVSMSPYMVSLRAVSGLRRQVIDATVILFSNCNIKTSSAAGAFLANSLRYPMDILGMAVGKDDYDLYTAEFLDTLAKIEHAIKYQPIDPLTLVTILKSISWHAVYNDGPTKTAARAILQILPSSIEFLTIRTLIGGNDVSLEKINVDTYQLTEKQRLDDFAAALTAAYPDADQLRHFIEACIDHIELGSHKATGYAKFYQLSGVIETAPGLAHSIVLDAQARPTSKTRVLAGYALGQLFREDRFEFLRLAHILAAADDTRLQILLAGACGVLPGLGAKLGQGESELIKLLITSAKTDVVQAIIGSMRFFAKDYPVEYIELIKTADLGLSAKITDDALTFVTNDAEFRFEILTDTNVRHFLGQMVRIPKLDGRWIETFIAEVSAAFPFLTLAFFQLRVTEALKHKSWNDYRPCNYGPYGFVPLRFRQAIEFSAIVKSFFYWASTIDPSSYRAKMYVSELFGAAFLPFDQALIDVLDGHVVMASSSEISMISGFLREAQQDFVFEQREFVIRVLERAKTLGPEQMKSLQSNILASAIQGLRTGAPGEPFPQDLKMRDNAAEALKFVPRFSPAYPIYQDLLRHAESEINRAIQEGKEMDDA